MNILKKIKAGIACYNNDTKGNFTIMAGVMMSALMMGTGTAYDYSQVAKARAYAQIAADNMALAASIAVDTKNQSRYIENQSYPYSEIGGPQGDFTGTMSGKVNYNTIDTDGETLIARATVTGTYTPAFGKIIGINALQFAATSDVSYTSKETTPASIFFITDNSGSMGWRDNGNRIKLTSLKQSMRSFMQSLNDIPPSDDRIIRTSLVPYSSGIINNKVVNPKWGMLTNGQINRMRANGGTRSTSSLTRVRGQIGAEANIHRNENGVENPLKFVIFMSDGANNGAYWGQICTPGATPEYWMLWGTRYNTRQWWFDHWYYRRYVTHHPGTGTCIPGWISPENDASLQQCTDMKQDPDLKIFSIAYDIGNQRDVAEQFMKDCSSGSEYYQYAEDGTDLNEIFELIGDKILSDVIRIKH